MPATKKRRCTASVARKMPPRWLFARQPHHLSVPSLKARAGAHTVRRTGLRRRLVRRFFARMNGVPQLFTARLLLRLPPPCFSLRLRRRVAWLYPPAARRSSTRAPRRRPSNVPHAERDRLLPQPAFSARGVPRQGGCYPIGAIAYSPRDSRISAAGGRHTVGRRSLFRYGAFAR